MEEICILIPAYNPDKSLILLLNGLKESLPDSPVIVVNDGSASEEIFNELLKNGPPPDKILTHSVNLGKGEALKNGFKYINDNYNNCKGVITADCDLQHSVEDIVKIANFLSKSCQTMFLGSRNFNNINIPFRSFIGNKFISAIFKIIYKIQINDTQTGLRGIPRDCIKLFLDINNSDFSFETLMLIKAHKHNIPIEEIPISTIYIKKNKNSHFKPLSDSYKICKSLLRKTY